MRDSRYIVWVVSALIGLLVLFVIYRIGQAQSHSAPAPLSLSDYVQTDAQVIFTVEGPVTANERYYSRTITVSADDRSIEADGTYSTTPLVIQNYLNTQPAFADFMYALQRAGFTKSRKVQNSNELGACATGQRFTYELMSDQNIIMKTWTSSCENTSGTFGGNAEAVNNLFEQQVLNYSQVLDSATKIQAAQVSAAAAVAASAISTP
jgi:hypothetical protein